VLENEQTPNSARGSYGGWAAWSVIRTFSAYAQMACELLY